MAQVAKAPGSPAKKKAGGSPGIKLDVGLAQQLMADAVVIAGSEEAHQHADYLTWKEKIAEFSKLVDSVGYRASIALLGSALIAKATNDQINPLALRANAAVPGAYNVRCPAEDVLYPASLDHGFDIGSNSRNPLNGQTFNKLKSIDLTLHLRGRGQELVAPLLALLHDISLLKSREDAVRALAAYVEVRRTYKKVYAAPTGTNRIQSLSTLSDVIATWVRQDSEGGGRTQAAVGGLFDAVYGEDRVRVGKLNEPDRKVAGDVCLLHDDGTVEKAIEARDKIVSRTDVLSVTQKLARAGIRKGAIMALFRGQESIETSTYSDEAAKAGIHLEIFYRWRDIIHPAVFWSEKGEQEIIAETVHRIRARAIELTLTNAAIEQWDGLTLHRSEAHTQSLSS